MVGTDLALMIADIKRVSQVFQWFKSVDMLEKSALRQERIYLPWPVFDLTEMEGESRLR